MTDIVDEAARRHEYKCACNCDAPKPINALDEILNFNKAFMEVFHPRVITNPATHKALGEDL